MTMEQKNLYNVIINLPDELSDKVIEYIDYLKFSYVTNNAPESVTIKSKEDLVNKLEEGISDTESGKVCSLDEAFSKIEKMLN